VKVLPEDPEALAELAKAAPEWYEDLPPTA
jgi:hypothetical protein